MCDTHNTFTESLPQRAGRSLRIVQQPLSNRSAQVLDHRNHLNTASRLGRITAQRGTPSRIVHTVRLHAATPAIQVIRIK